MTARIEFRFSERLRVRWAEIDAQKIVFNGHYLMYIDTTIAGYWRALALPYEQTLQRFGGDLYVKKASLEYHASALYDDLIDVGIRCPRIGNSSLVFCADVLRGEQALVKGELVYVFADPATQRSKPIPALLRDALQAFEAGAEMIDVRIGSWQQLGGDAHPIRRAVLVREQGVPADIETDGADATALHAVAYNRLGVALGTGRLIEETPALARIGRMAVLPGMRGSGIGRALLDALLKAARQAGARQAALYAERSAVGFYRRAGFVENGPPYDVAGIAHVDMARAL